MITETERLILYGIKHIIERESWSPGIRKKLDEDICNKIVDLVAPLKNEESACDMKEGKQGEICNLCGFTLGTREDCINCQKFVVESNGGEK